MQMCNVGPRAWQCAIVPAGTSGFSHLCRTPPQRGSKGRNTGALLICVSGLASAELTAARRSLESFLAKCSYLCVRFTHPRRVTHLCQRRTRSTCEGTLERSSRGVLTLNLSAHLLESPVDAPWFFPSTRAGASACDTNG